MPRSVTLASYALAVHRPYKSHDLEPLDAVGSPALPFRTILTNFFDGLASQHLDVEATQHLLRLRNEIKDEKGSLYGWVDGGEYGHTSMVVDRVSGEDKYDKGTDDADVIPHYFNIYIPENGMEAILLIERYGVHSIFSALITALREKLRQNLSPRMLRVRPLVPGEVLRAVLEGEVRRIDISTYGVPKDIGSPTGLHGYPAEDVTLDISIAPRRRAGVLQVPPFVSALINKIRGDLVSNTRSGKVTAVALPPILTRPDSQIQVAMNYKGKSRTVVLGDRAEGLAPYLDITDQVKFAKSGHPTLASIHAVATEHMDSLKEDLGIQ